MQKFQRVANQLGGEKIATSEFEYFVRNIRTKGAPKAANRAINVLNKKLYSAPEIIKGTFTKAKPLVGSVERKWYANRSNGFHVL